MNQSRRQGSRDPLTNRVIGLAIAVHRELGPGLLESAHEERLCYELQEHNIAFRRQVALPVRYKDVNLERGYRIDLVIEDSLIVELKAVDELIGVHDAQLLTCLRLGGIHTGLLMNFNSAVLKDGIRRLVL